MKYYLRLALIRTLLMVARRVSPMFDEIDCITLVDVRAFLVGEKSPCGDRMNFITLGAHPLSSELIDTCAHLRRGSTPQRAPRFLSKRVPLCLPVP